LEAVLSVANLLAEEGTLSEKITRAMAHVLQVSSAKGATYRALTEEGTLELYWTVGDPGITRVFQGRSPVRSGGIVDCVLKAEGPVCEDNYAELPTSRKRLVDAGVGSVAGFPVRTRRGICGVIVVACERTSIGQETLSLVTAISNYIGTMIEQAMLLDAEREYARELSALLSINRVLASPEPLEERATTALRILNELTGAERSMLRLARGEDRELELIAKAGYKHVSMVPVQTSPDSISNQAFATGEVVLKDRFRYTNEPGSVIALPLSTPRGRIGAVVLSSPNEEHFTPGVISLIEPMVAAMGAMIEAQQLRTEIDVQQALAVRRDNFIATASHELRTPMTTLIGLAELLIERDPADSSERQRWYSMIHRESSRLCDIVSDMLDVTRIQSGKLQLEIRPVHLAEIVESVVAPLRESTDAHELIVEIPDDVPLVSADPKKLVQVLLNLVSNAIKYSPDGGQVRVEVSADPSSGQVAVSVSDQGMGIPEEGIAVLFEPFGRVRNEQTAKIRGTGLGLYISKNLVEGMGGQISVESVVNHGSTFTLDLPLAA
jgi:signal transduction histidine kinase